MTIRDMRNAGWCWQEKATLDVLRAFYSGDKLKRRATALAVYLVLTELASNKRSTTHAEATHRAIWERTGTSETTVKQYLREFVAAGLIAVERQKVDRDINLPNVYRLLTPGATDSPTPATETGEGGATDSPTPATNGHHPEEPSLNNESQDEDALLRRIARTTRLALATVSALANDYRDDAGHLDSRAVAALWARAGEAGRIAESLQRAAR